MKLKTHFKTTQPLAKKDVIQFTKSSSEKKWTTKETHHTIEAFIGAFNKELEIEEKNKKAIPKSRSSRPRVFCKKGVLSNFAKLTGKHMCESLFF